MNYKYERPVSAINNLAVRNDSENGGYAVNIGHCATNIDASDNKQVGQEVDSPYSESTK